MKQGMTATALLEFRQALALAEGIAPCGVGRERGQPGGEATDVPALRLRIIRALSDRGLWDEAMAEARRGLEREPDSEALRLAWAEAGDPGRAMAPAAWPRSAAARGSTSPGYGMEASGGRPRSGGDAPRWLDAMVRGAVAGVPDTGQYEAVVRRLDQAFRRWPMRRQEAERRVLAGQLSPAAFGTAAARRLAQARAVGEYLGRLAYPEESAAAHQAREEGWEGLARAGEQAVCSPTAALTMTWPPPGASASAVRCSFRAIKELELKREREGMGGGERYKKKVPKRGYRTSTPLRAHGPEPCASTIPPLRHGQVSIAKQPYLVKRPCSEGA